MSNPFEKYVQATFRQNEKLDNAKVTLMDTTLQALAPNFDNITKPNTGKSAGDLLVDAAASALKIPTIVGGVAVGAADLALSAASKPFEWAMDAGHAVRPDLIPKPMEVGYGYIAKGLHDTIGYRPEEAKAFIDEKLFSDARKIQEKEYQSGYTAAEDKAFQDTWVNNYQTQVANLQKSGATEQQLKDFNTGFDKQYQEAATQRADKYQTSWDKPLSENIDIIGHGFDNLLENPSLALGGAIESGGYLLPSMLVSRGVLALEKAAKVAKLGAGGVDAIQPLHRFAAAGVGEGSVAGTVSLEHMRSQTPDGIAGGKELLGALGVAASTGLIGAGFGKAASKLGIGDIDSVGLGRAASQVAAMKLPALARPVGAVAQEGAEEFAQTFGESIIPNVTMGKDPLEGLGQELPLGTLAGAIMGAGMSAPSLVSGGFSDISSGLGKVKGAVSDAVSLKSFETLSNPEHKNYNPAQAFNIQLKNLESNDETVRTQAEASVSKIETDLNTARASVEKRIKNIQATLKAMPPSDQTTDAQKLEIEVLSKEYSALTTKSSTLADQYVAFLDAQVTAQEHRDAKQGTQFTEEQAKADITTLTQPTPIQTVWSNQYTDIPVEVIGEPETDESGNQFTKVRYTPQEGADPIEMYVPTSELVSTQGSNAVAQQEALNRVTRHFSKYSNDDLDLLATSPVLTETQRNSLRLMSKSKRELAAVQDPSQVFDNILNGYKGKTIQESHRGLNQYTDMVNTAVATKNEQLASLALDGLGSFTDDHTAKRDTINEAFGLVQKGTYKEIRVVKTQDGTWGMIPFTAQEVRAGKNADGVVFLEDDALKEELNSVGGFNVHINSNIKGAITQINNETQLIQDRFDALSGVAESFVGVTPKPIDTSTAPTIDTPIVTEPSDTTAPVDSPVPKAPVQSVAPATPATPTELKKGTVVEYKLNRYLFVSQDKYGNATLSNMDGSRFYTTPKVGTLTLLEEPKVTSETKTPTPSQDTPDVTEGATQAPKTADTTPPVTNSIKVVGTNTLITSGVSGLTHSVPTKLVDKMLTVKHEIANILQITSGYLNEKQLKYVKELLTAMIGLNDTIRVGFYADLSKKSTGTSSGSRIYIDLTNSRPLDILELLTHEYHHAVTAQILDSLTDPKHPVNEALAKVTQVLKDFMNTDPKMSGHIKSRFDNMQKNFKELITTGTTEPQVIARLRTIPITDTQSAYDVLVEQSIAVMKMQNPKKFTPELETRLNDIFHIGRGQVTGNAESSSDSQSQPSSQATDSSSQDNTGDTTQDRPSDQTPTGQQDSGSGEAVLGTESQDVPTRLATEEEPSTESQVEPVATEDAKVTVLQGVTDKIAAEERKKPFNLRNILKGYFTQSTTKEDAVGANPLVTVKDFLSNFDVRTQVGKWLNDRRKPTLKQLEQVEHFKKFHAEFARALKFVFNTQASAIYVSNKENLVGYMEMGKKASTRELDENVVTALALSAYSYLIKQGNKVMNTNEELETLFRLKKGVRAPLEIEQMFRFAGQEMPIVVKALGTDAAKALGLKVREDQDPTLQDRLNTALGILAMEAMANAGFIVIETLQDHPTDEKNKPLTDFLTTIKAVRESKTHTIEDEYDFEVDTDAKTQIKKFTMVRPNAKMEGIGNSVFEKGIIETEVDGKIVRTETLTLNRPVLTEGLPTLNSSLVNELIEANKDTKGFLSYLFGVDVGLTTPLKEIPKKFSQRLINGTDASVPSVQAELLTEAQKHSFTMRTNTVAVFAAMQKLGKNSQFLKEVLGIWIDDHVLSRTHVTERDSLQAKAQNDWTAVLNGLEWAEATLDENGQYTQFYDTHFVAQNQRQHLNSNMFSAQSSQIHRAMAALTGFSTTIDLTKDEALLNLFYQAVGEGLEGLDDYLKADILAKAEAGLHQFFTVDKVYGDFYVPALKAFLETDASKNAIKAMRALIETGTINTDQQKDIAAFVNKGRMGAQSLQSLIALAELDIAQDSKEQILTTTIGFGSDGVNHGVSAANMLTGVISKDMRQQTGIFPIAEKGQDQISNMQEVYKRKITDYYVDFGKVMSSKLRDLVDSFIGGKDNPFVQGMTALFPKFEVLDDTRELRNLLDMRKIAKIWAIPFNYSAGKAALQRALARGFLAGIYGNMNKLANEALDIIDAQKEKGITAEQLAALDLKLATVVLKTTTLQDNLNKVLGRYGMSVTLPAPQLLNEEDKGKLSSDRENTLMQAAIELHGEAAWQATEEFAKDYLQVRNVYTEVEKASFTLFDVVRSRLIEEKKANRKFTNTAAKVQVKRETVQYTAEELNAQEAEYFGLTTVEMAEIDAVLAAMRPMFNTALSIGSESTNDASNAINPSGVSVRKHKMQREPAKGLRAVNTFYLKEIDAKGKPFSESRNIGLTKEVEENAGVASSANAVQSIDAFVAAKVQGFMDALNVHDAAIFGLKNFLKGVKKQNEEHLKALTNYQLGLEHAKMLVKVYVGYKAFMATQELALKSEDATIKENAQKLITEANKQIRTLLRGEQMFKRGKPLLDQARNLMFKGGLIPKLQAANLDIGNDAEIEEAISVFINFALAHDLQKLEVLLDTYSIHQFAGEGGMHQLTDDNRASIDEQKALVNKAKEDLQAQLKDKTVEQVAEVKTPEATKQVSPKVATTEKPMSPLVKFLESKKDAEMFVGDLIQYMKSDVAIDAKLNAQQQEVLKALEPLLNASTKVVYADATYEGYGYFDEPTNTIHIKSEQSEGSNVNSQLAIHELLHSVLSLRIKALDASIAAKTTEATKTGKPATFTPAEAALNKLDELRQIILSRVKGIPALSEMLKNVDEFISYGLTDQRLQQVLGAVPIERNGRTAPKVNSKWRTFVLAVMKVTGFKSGGTITALSAFAMDTAALLETIGSVTPVVAPNNGERLFSKNTSSGNGLTVASTRQILVKQFGEKLIKALEAKGLLRIVETMKGIPEAALRSIKAYHGSPANFDKFMREFVNSGEGAQAFGWGHYLAGRKALAEWYRTVLSNDVARTQFIFRKDGERIKLSDLYKPTKFSEQVSESTLLGLFREYLLGDYNKSADTWEADVNPKYDPLAKVNRDILEYAEDTNGYVELNAVRQILVQYKAKQFSAQKTSTSYRGTGQLYELEVAAKEESFLNWFTKFEDLANDEQQALLGVFSEFKNFQHTDIESKTVGEIYSRLTRYTQAGTPMRLSQALQGLGYSGIKFLDQESRKRPYEKQYFNYVVFDENIITIKDKYYSKDSDNTEGYYHNGQATLIAENLTPETVVATLLHELSGHKGFQELMEPAAYNALMKQFDKLVAEGNPIALAALKRAQEATGSDGKPLSLQGQMDEYLPYLLTIQAAINATQAQKSAIAKFIDNVFRAVRAWAYKKLQTNGYEGAASTFMQPQDIVYTAERMLREMVNNPVTSSNTQSPIKFSTQSAEDHVNGQSSLDIMQALPHSNTGAFNQQLDRLITEEIGQLYNQDDAAKARIDEIQTFTASDALNAGFTLSRKEQYVQQALQYAVAAYMKLHAGGANVGQLRRVYHAAKAKMDITGKGFHEGDWSTATQQEQDLAKAKYDFLFDSTKEGYMDRFVSMALASESVSKILDIALPLTKPETQDKTWFETVNDWVSYVMAWLTNKYVRLNPVAGASNQLVQLMDNLVKLDIRNRQEGVAFHQKAWNTIGLVTTPLNKALKGAGGALLSGVGLRDSRFLPVRALGAILVLRSEEAAKAIPKMIIDMRNNQLPNTKLGEVANILLEASGVGTLRDKFDVLIRQTNLNAKNRQDIVDNVKKAVNTWFKEPLTKVQSKAIAYGLLGTDAQALLENYSVEDIVNMALHEGKLNAEIAKLKKEIAKNPNGNDMLNAAEQLGYYMVTRIGGEGLVKNALGISIGLGTQYFTSVEQADPKLVGQLNTLVSMLAMTHVPNSDKAILAALYKTDAEGIHATIQLHQGLVNDSLKDFQANPLNMVKGWMPEVTNPYLEIKAANSMVERQQMEAEGWVLIDELKRDKHDKGSPKYLMKHNDIGYQRLVSGAVDLGSTARSGTEAINRTSPKYLGITQARYQNAARRAAIPNGSFDPSKQPRGLIAAYDTDGVALGYNYEMDNETRDAHLDRKHNTGDLLGTFGGLNYYKPEKTKQSNVVAEVLFEDYKANYSQNPNAYLKLSHKSTDPKVVEMWRMLPQDFKQRATELYGKGNPIIIRNEAFNLAFGFKKFSVVSYAFDAVKAERERIKNGLVGTGKSPNAFQSGFVRLAEATRGNTAQADFAKAEHVTQEIVKAIKDFIVIRSGTTMMWNIFANVLMLMANGINPVTIIKDWVFAVTNVRAYQKLNSQLIQAQADLAGGKDPIALKQKIGALKAELKANVMNPYINAGLLSSIVEDVNIQQGEYTYTSAFKQTVDGKTQWIPKPVKTAAKVLTIAPSTKLYQFLATTTQLSDFVAKYSMSKHLQANGTDINASIIEASKTFINYDLPTSQGLQYANDMGLFMFTKFFLRIQAVLMKLLGKRAGSAIAQHLLVENLTGAEGVLSPMAFGHIGNNPLESSVFGLPSAFFSIGTVDAVTDVGAPF